MGREPGRGRAANPALEPTAGVIERAAAHRDMLDGDERP
jgi:hypothetical protein